MNVTDLHDKLVIESPKKIMEILDGGKALDIIFALLVSDQSEDDLIRRLEISPMKLKVYLSRLENHGIIGKYQQVTNRNTIKTTYQLKIKDLEMLANSSQEIDKLLQMKFNIAKYHEFIENGFKSLYSTANRTNKHSAIFIRSNEEKMKRFKERLNILIDDFMAQEDENDKEIYLFTPMLFPYLEAILNSEKELVIGETAI